MSDKYFKISSALKNLIGSDLITDNFVAVFELVKNSFDAGATEVKITFDKIYSKNAKIIIQDNGKGMDYDDLMDKWLFLAYSGKRDGSEDYRDKIKSGRVYAGAKGVGRFSCDRLGKFLTLITKTKNANSKIESILVDWAKFEKNQKIEFSRIPVVHSILKKAPYNLKHGTVLEIAGIPPDFWNRDNFRKLKEKLSKLIRPDLNTSDEVQKFKIILNVPDEIEKDTEVLSKLRQQTKSNIQQYYSTINGEIKNFVFNELDIKTTKIESFIDKNSIITTKLTDRENFIYEIKEKSEYPLLANVGVTLYFLNRSAKSTFHRRTGVEHVEFGSLFIYKNGFRIYPYGERNDDSLGIDNRAMQGYARYIGLRSLMGEMSIQGANQELRETTSRGDGLVKNNTFHQLTNKEDGFLIKTLRRLEKYVIDVTQWGVNNEDETENLSEEKVKENLVRLIANISDDKSVIQLKYNKDVINLVAGKEEKSAKKLVSNFKRIAAESKDSRLMKDATRIEKAITSSLKRADSAIREKDKKIEEKKEVEKDLEQKTQQLRIVTAISSQDLETVTHLHHQVLVVSENIKDNLTLISRKLEKGDTISTTELKDFINKISFDNSKIESISKFGIRAIFEDFTSISKKDIIEFIENYIEKISSHFNSKRKIKVEFENLLEEGYETKFRPLDISIIIDNMISNAKKADASHLLIQATKNSNNKLILIVRDNGNGLNKSIKNPSDIFEKGFSTTKSTGLGLFHVKNLINDNKWKIDLIDSNKKGLEFQITLS